MNGRSLVAGANAWFRAAESRRAPGARILDDPFAARLAERDARVQLLRFARFALPPLGRMLAELQVAHCVRHRAVDELVLRAVADGFKQVVVVGAGYDMRPARFAARLDGVRWIELDLPAIQARKERLLARQPVPTVERAPIDLAHATLEDALARTQFERARPTCFVVEGVVHYLARPRVEALLASAAALASPARVLLSYIRADMYARATPLFVRLVQTVREVPSLHFTPVELQALCARHGFAHFRAWTFEDQVRELAPEAGRRRARLSQDVVQLSA